MFECFFCYLFVCQFICVGYIVEIKLNKGIFLLSPALSPQFNTYIPLTPFEALKTLLNSLKSHHPC